MYNINPLYTGEGSEVRLPELDNLERSSQRANDLLIRGEEMKLDKVLKDKDTFQKMLSIDPITAVSTANATRQAKMLEEYNNKWADRYVKSKGELTFADELEMNKDRKLLEAEQNKMLADQKQFESYESTMNRNTNGYWDRNHYDLKKKEYFDTGVLPRDMLKIAPQDFGIAIGKSGMTGTPTTVIKPVPNEKGENTDYEQEYDAIMTEAEAEERIPQFAMTNEAYMEDIIRKFDQLSEEEQMKVIGDYNGDGKVNPDDVKYAHNSRKITDNPIMKWASKNPYFKAQAMQLKPRGTAKRKVQPKAVADKNQVKPGVKRTSPIPYGNKTYYNTYAFSSRPTLSNVPTAGAIVFSDEGSETLDANGSIQGILKDYIQDEDILVIEASKGYENLGISSGGNIGVPADKIEGVDNLPIVVDGKQTTLGAIRGKGNTQPTATAKLSFAEWRKANPKAPVSDYKK